MSTLKKLDRTQVELFNSWKPHDFKRAPERRHPDVRRTMSQLGPRPSDFIVAPDWVSEDADMTKAFSGRTHRPWNFEFPGARYWPPAPAEVKAKVSNHFHQHGSNRTQAISGDIPRPSTTSSPENARPNDTISYLPTIGHPVKKDHLDEAASMPYRGDPYVQGGRYLPFLEALGTTNYSLNKKEDLAKPAFSRYFAHAQKDCGHLYPTKYRNTLNAKAI